MHEKRKLARLNGSIYNILTEAANICNIFPIFTDSNKFVVVKLKRDLKYRGYVYLELLWPNVIYQALN